MTYRSSRSSPENCHTTRYFDHSLDNPPVIFTCMLTFRVFIVIQTRFQYPSAHPRRNAAHAASCTPSISSNFFTSFCFRTLASHFQTSVSSNSVAIKRFCTLYKIPGIGYPPRSIFLDRPLLIFFYFPLFHHARAQEMRTFTQ